MTKLQDIKELKAKIDNASRHVGTGAKKVRAMIKGELPTLVQTLIDEVYNPKSKLSDYQKMGLIKDLIKLGIDTEKIIDAHKKDKQVATLFKDDDGDDTKEEVKETKPKVVVKMTAS